MNKNTTITKIAKAVALGALGVAAFGITAPTASAATSGNTNNCWAQWGNTGWSGHCKNSTAAGQYQTRATCDWEPDLSSKWIYLKKNYTGKWTHGECIFKVSRAYVAYSD
ncbi:hypothetical protein ACIPRU_02005 [Streptomyces sp. NPDC090126]|uniref:hypothetical protein n=1 Tax=Streptomyces sp. NPDC090126 TaxID=3365952 RepID=UPI0037FE8A75